MGVLTAGQKKKGMVKKMEILYSSTRNGGRSVTASQAILQGLSEDGGLFVPDHIPALPLSMRELADKNYQETAYEVMRLF